MRVMILATSKPSWNVVGVSLSSGIPAWNNPRLSCFLIRCISYGMVWMAVLLYSQMFLELREKKYESFSEGDYRLTVAHKRFYYRASSVSGQDESNPALWLATRAGKMELSCPLGTTRRVPQEKFSRKAYNKSFIDQACSVKMAGYWPRSFFASLWTETETKKNLANIQPSWPHTWSITHTYWLI